MRDKREGWARTTEDKVTIDTRARRQTDGSE
jgi:hypothetical protein